MYAYTSIYLDVSVFHNNRMFVEVYIFLDFRVIMISRFPISIVGDVK